MKLIYYSKIIRSVFLSAILGITTISASAQYSASWLYILPISISENSGNTLYEYQVPVVVNTSAPIAQGHMNSDGSDIRFGSAQCDTVAFWIESGINTDSTVIWVRVPMIPANSSTVVKMYYGNSNASATSSLGETWDGPNSSTDSVSGGTSGGAANCQRGFKFSVSNDIIVTHFGQNRPISEASYVTIFNATSQAIVEQHQVSAGSSGQYHYDSLSNYMWLNSGTSYVLALHSNSSGYYYGSSSAAGEDISYNNMQYCNSCGQNTFPTSTLNGIHYGYPDFLYFKRKHASTEPTFNVGGETSNSGGGSLTISVSNDVTMCVGDTTTLTVNVTGNSSYSYSWSPSIGLDSSNTAQVNASPNDTTTYTINVVDLISCAAATDQVTVNINPLPEIELGADRTICSDSSSTFDAGPGLTYSWSTGATTQTITASTATSIGVTVTDSYGCVNFDGINLYVEPIPSIIFTTDTGICPKSALLMKPSISGGSVYAWSNGTSLSSVVATEPGVYTITVTNTNTGCDAELSINVAQYDSADVDLGANAKVKQENLPFVIDAGPYKTFLWNTGATTQTISIYAAGTYTVSVTDFHGCPGNDDKKISIIPLGISELSLSNIGVELYPNPTNGIVTLNLAQGLTQITIEDIKGRKLWSVTEPAQGTHSIDLTEFPSGIYILNATANDQTYSQKIIRN
jgi:hypothetical protein